MGETLIFTYWKLGNDRYLRNLSIEGKEKSLFVNNPLNLGIVEGNPEKDFNKYKKYFDEVKVCLNNQD